MSGKQDWQTPPELFAACEKRFGEHHIDLAATRENSKCHHFLGPGSNWSIHAQDSLSVNWGSIMCERARPRGFLNPGFANMKPWIARCIEASKANFRVTLVCLPSLETKWAREAIRHADVYHLWPRVPFVDPEHPEKKSNDRNTMILDFNGCDRRRPPCNWNWQKNEIQEFV